MPNTRLTLLAILLFITTPIYPQNNIESVMDMYQTGLDKYPSELVYFQTSKEIYETGEDVWFKAYQLDARSLGLSDGSKTLYLQMATPQDSIVWQEMYPIESGIVKGHIYLDEKLPEGEYFLTGFTKYSVYNNDSLGIIPSRKIKVVKNIAETSLTKIPGSTAGFKFAVFPEGGNMVSGISSTLAFKATDGKGTPVEVEGVLYEDNEPLLPITTTHHGMGSTIFTPLAGKKYHIELNNNHSIELPEIYPEGMVLKLIRQEKDTLHFSVSQSEYMPLQQISLVGQMRGVVYCVAQGKLRNELKIKIPTEDFLYQGIAEFTLLNEQLKPIAERLVYLHPEKKLNIIVEPSKKSFLTREEGALKIKVTDENGIPVRANLGLTIYDKVYDDPGNPVNITSYCYLSSQIRGTIYDPLYYVDEKNTDRKEAMDLLLLTQGWRRYIWNTNDFTYRGKSFLTDEITGIQTTGSKKKNVQTDPSEQFIMVSGPDGNSELIMTDSLGRFFIDPQLMAALRGGYVYLKPMVAKESKRKLTFLNNFPSLDSISRKRTTYYSFTNLTFASDEQRIIPYIFSKDSTILLDEITITGKSRRPYRDKFMGRLDSLAQMDIDMPWVDPQGHLENYRSGYTLHHDPRYCPNPIYVPMEDRKKPVEGETYYLMKPKYFENGAFIVEDEQWVIYKGPLFSDEELLKKNNYYRTKGYYANREFYEPDEFDVLSPLPDARNTLLWSPSILTDEKGEATISFYCSDINTGFIGVVEGVDGLGLLGTAKCEFRVMKY